MQKQRWRMTKGNQYRCSYCDSALDKRYINKSDLYHYCSSACNMWDVGMDYGDFY